MAQLNIKTNKRRLNLFEQGETEVYITSPVTYSKITSDALLEAAARNSGVKQSVIYSGVLAVTNEFENFLLNGHSVQVPGLGTFRVSIRAKAVATQKEAGGSAVYRRSISYTPAPELKNKLQNMQLSAISSDILTSADDEEPAGDDEHNEGD